MNNKSYKLQDGGKITATCAADFVTKLRESSMFDSDCTDQEYMHNFKLRYKDQSGHEIRDDEPDNFVNDLIQSGFIAIE